jgi:hypothetical protein
MPTTRWKGIIQGAEETLVVIDVSELKGITAEIATVLHVIGIQDSAQFLAAVGQPRMRVELAATLGVDVSVVLELANRADLMRIHGLSGGYVDMLELAGVGTVTELRYRNPENLYAKLLTIAAHHHVSQLPRLDEVQRWVSDAKQLERAVHY